MTRNATIALGLIVLAASPLSAQRMNLAAPEEVGLSSGRLQRIGEVFEDYAEEGRIAGAVGMVLRHGKLVYLDAWGCETSRRVIRWMQTTSFASPL